MSVLKIRKILVAVADPARANKAVRRAAEIAHKSGASVELFHATAASGISVGVARAEAEEFTRAMVALSRRQLERMANRLRREELLVTANVQTGYPIHEAILRQVQTSAPDVLIIEAHKHNLFARLLLSQTDFELIRRCPVPLLIVKGRSVWRSPRVLAALDPFHASGKPNVLDAQIVDAARGFADALGGSLHATHIYRPLIYFIPGTTMDPVVITATPAQDRAHRLSVLRRFTETTDRFGISPKRRHLRMGDPSIELPSMARGLHASLVVMGAVSRSGLNRVFVGHTAERALDSLQCDVLVVKPKGFSAPK